MLINAVQAVEDRDEAEREIAIATGSDEKGNPLFTLRDRGPGIALYRRLGDHQYRRLTFLLILATGVLLSLRALQA
jgi:hypothetical protein